MFKYFLFALFGAAASNAALWESPCPRIFQYGFSDEEPVGIYKIKIPIENAQNFFTIVEMLPKAQNYSNPDIIPTVELLKKDQPEEVLRDIYSRRKTTFVIRYNKMASVFNYKIFRIWFNEHIICEAEDTNFVETGPNSLVLRITGHYKAPENVAEGVRKEFPNLQTEEIDFYGIENS